MTSKCECCLGGWLGGGWPRFTHVSKENIAAPSLCISITPVAPDLLPSQDPDLLSQTNASSTFSFFFYILVHSTVYDDISETCENCQDSRLSLLSENITIVSRCGDFEELCSFAVIKGLFVLFKTFLG